MKKEGEIGWHSNLPSLWCLRRKKEEGKHPWVCLFLQEKGWDDVAAVSVQVWDASLAQSGAAHENFLWALGHAQRCQQGLKWLQWHTCSDPTALQGLAFLLSHFNHCSAPEFSDGIHSEGSVSSPCPGNVQLMLLWHPVPKVVLNLWVSLQQHLFCVLFLGIKTEVGSCCDSSWLPSVPVECELMLWEAFFSERLEPVPVLGALEREDA